MPHFASHKTERPVGYLRIHIPRMIVGKGSQRTQSIHLTHRLQPSLQITPVTESPLLDAHQLAQLEKHRTLQHDIKQLVIAQVQPVQFPGKLLQRLVGILSVYLQTCQQLPDSRSLPVLALHPCNEPRIDTQHLQFLSILLLIHCSPLHHPETQDDKQSKCQSEPAHAYQSRQATRQQQYIDNRYTPHQHFKYCRMRQRSISSCPLHNFGHIILTASADMPRDAEFLPKVHPAA